MILKLHRLSACLMGGFIAVHLANHLVALGGIDDHIAFMESFRKIYRLRVVELLLLSCVLFQILSGLIFIKRRWGKRQGFYDRLQSISGGYLAFFLLNHVGAVLLGRAFFKLDTNFYFAAAGIHITPFQFFFIPYYFLAVVAVFSHLACASHWLLRDSLTLKVRDQFGYGIITTGILAALVIVLALAGGFYPVDIPTQYEAIYGGE